MKYLDVFQSGSGNPLFRPPCHFSLTKSSPPVEGDETREMSVVAAGSLVRTDPKISARPPPGEGRQETHTPAITGRTAAAGGGGVDCCREVPERGEYLGVRQSFSRCFAPVRE